MENDLIDLEFSRPHYLGKKLIFKPHFGFRGGWIDQKYNLEAQVTWRSENESSFYFNVSSKSWLIGPRAGLDSQWLLGEGFSLFGNLASSLCYQHFNVKYKETTVPDLALEFNSDSKTKDYYVNPNLEFAVGINWGSYLAENQYHIDLSAGYEFHIFWNQNQMSVLKNDNNQTPHTKAGDLMLHGLTISGRFDF